MSASPFRVDWARPHLALGAHALPLGGVRFAVWAPNASRVAVVGDFNAWNGEHHALARSDDGVWVLEVPDAQIGQLYKYQVDSNWGHRLPLKADPYARTGEMRPGNASRIVAPMAPLERPMTRAAANRRDAPMAIYEVHLGSWRRRSDGSFLDWDELAASLPGYVGDLGFTHLELMPITEHPLDASWGYQTLGMFAVTARHGDAEGFRRFVQACHARGLGVILDWVPGHFPTDAHGMGQFDGGALYEYADPRLGFHRDWNTLIYDYGRNEVRSFLAGSALHWLETFGLDGLRVDAVASMLYRDYSRPDGQWVPNVHGGRENLEVISLFKEVNTVVGAQCEGAITVAEESTAFPRVSAPVHVGGLGFHYKWNMGWMNDTLSYMHEDPVHRRYHHDKMRFGLTYAFSENFVLPISHDEVVHGKGSLLNKMPGDEWQRFANLRAYLGFMWGHPGKKLLFMGQEWGQRSEWNFDAALPWHELDHAPHQGVRDFVRALNGLHRSEAALHRLDCEPRGFEWLVHDDKDQSIFAWVRRDGMGGEVLVACNFTPVPRSGYRVGVPDWSPKAWRRVLTSDDVAFGGSGWSTQPTLALQPESSHARARSLVLDVPPLSTTFWVPVHE